MSTCKDLVNANKGILKLKAEVERLTIRNCKLEIDRAELSTGWEKAAKERDVLQSHLGKICSPRRRRGCGELSLLRQNGYEYSAQCLEAVDDYLDSQKPSEKTKYDEEVDALQRQCWEEAGRFHDGRAEDCPICNPKPSEKPCCHQPNLGKDCPMCNSEKPSKKPKGIRNGETGRFTGYIHLPVAAGAAHVSKSEDCPICNPPKCEHKMVSVDWLFESCPHSEPMMLNTRHECDECMDELLKMPREQKL